MTDDRELVERLAAIDATPRAGWVAELRADLDASWETERASYLDSPRMTTATLHDYEPTPSEPTSSRRWLILIAAAAAVVVAIALVATRHDDATPADQPSPTVTVTPRELPNLVGEALEPGTYYVDEVSGTPTPRIFATLDSGWFDRDQSPGWAHIVKGQWPGVIGYVAISTPVAVFSDACHRDAGYYPGSVATVDGFVTALREQQGGWVGVTTPSDISVDGYGGKAFQRTAPAVMSDCTTWNGRPIRGAVPSWENAFPSWESADGANLGYEPGQVETLWVLDVDGTVVVISTELWPGPSATAHADFADAVLDSIRIDGA